MGLFLVCSRDRLVLLVEPEGEKRGVGDLLDLEADTWDITDGVTLTTETGDKHLVVLINEAHSTVARHVARNSLVVLFELNSHALTHGRVGLLGFDTNLLDDDASGLSGSGERLLPLGDSVGLAVSLVGPSKRESAQLATCQQNDGGNIPQSTTYLLRRLFTRSLRAA